MMIKKLLTITFILLFFLIPSHVLAYDLEITCFSDQAPDIVRNTDPLFQLSGFTPGDSASRTIFIENNSSNHDCRIFFDVSGTTNVLTDKINVYIPTLFNNSLSEYMESSILMANLQPNQEITRTITMNLPTDAGNTYADKNASFDIEVISVWGPQDTSEVGGETSISEGSIGSVLGASTSVLGAAASKILGTLPQTGQNILLIVMFSIFALSIIHFYKKKRSLKKII